MILADLIAESSGYSLAGSYTPDLVFSKLWIARELTKIIDQMDIESIPVTYILGSWYGNLAILLRKKNLPLDKIIDVEKNKQWLKTGRSMQKKMGISNVQSMAADVNKIDYRQLGSPGLVINASTNDIPDHGWFDNIPPGTLVVIQGRDHASEGAEHTYSSPDDLLSMYPLEKVLYKGSMDLEDPETKYQRSMVIGIKGQHVLRELNFMGSPCTKDCSGHRAGYNWSLKKGRIHSASWSRSFNNGAAIAAAGL